MKPLLIAGLGLLLATPAAAFERMSRADCVAGFARLNDMFEPDRPDTPARRMGAAQVVSADGWCRMRGRVPGAEGVQFDRLDWRAEGIGPWIADGTPPLALTFRISGLEPDEMQGGDTRTMRPPLDVTATLRQIPETGQLIIERAEMSNGRGDVLAASAVFERVYLSSLAMAQVSLGSVTLKAGLLDMQFSGEVENPFAFEGELWIEGSDQARREAGFALLSELPDGVMNDASRAELTEFAAALPRPVGALELSLNSERGLGLMQAIMGNMQSFAEGDLVNWEVMLDGVTLGADWSPSTGQSD